MFSADVLKLDLEKTAAHIAETLRSQVLGGMRKKGGVLGISGGIDSACTAALSARAFGPERVLGIFMPERDSSDESLTYGKKLAEKFGIPTVTEVLGASLEAMGCYRWREGAVKKAYPEWQPGWPWKIVLPSILESDRLNFYYLVVKKPSGEDVKVRLPLEEYLTIVAATNMKQRLRKATEYFHGDRLNYAVAGTPNRLEYDQGFFVKQGDGAADFKPIAHLYKSQVYALAEHLGVPEEICRRSPTTDTYSYAQGQDEFYFALPYPQMDLCLYGKDHGVDPAEVGKAVGLSADQVTRVYKDIDAKRRFAKYLHARPALIEPIHAVLPSAGGFGSVEE
jgi:NAD+ synthase